MNNSILFVILAMILASCASSVKKEIEQEQAKVSVPCTSSENVQARITNIFENATKLTEEQKDKFIQLQVQASKDVCEINKEIDQLKVVLIQNIANKDFNEKKVNLISRNMKKLNAKKIDLMFSNLDKAKDILGVESPESYLDQYFIDFHNIY